MKNLLFIFVLMSVNYAIANELSWTQNTGAKIGVFNPGAEVGKTYISLDGVVFSGCSRTDGVFLVKENNSDYNEIYSMLLAAKMSEKLVRIYYESSSNCTFPEIKQAYLL